MREDYKPFVDRMIDKYEGGYGWNKKDPGGPTKYGITCYDLAAYYGLKMDSMAAWADRVRAMNRSVAEEIYRNKYATAVGFDGLPPGADVAMFDYAVNSGVGRPIVVARAILERAGYKDRPMNNIVAMGTEKFVHQLCAERLHFMHGIRNGTAWEEFGKGWGARVKDVEEYAKRLIALNPGDKAPDLTPMVPSPKATHSDPALATSVTTKAVTANAVQGSLQAAGGVNYWLIAATVAAVFAAAIAYVMWKKQQNNRANATVVLPSVGG